jgi:hypothetical protein|eukprot:COSAG02_NODE_4461_length_5336_cov_3.180829_3_plen_78_part_00
MVHPGEYWKVRCARVMFRDQATSKSWGPTPRMLWCAIPASYHGQPPPSITLSFIPAPITATFVRLVPHRIAVGLLLQ